MLPIEHRLNTNEHLQRVPSYRGIEVDIRDYDGAILSHDPFVSGALLDDLLAAYQHSLISLSIKSDGLIEPVLDLVDKYKVDNYFLLDLSPPTFVKCYLLGLHKMAVRYSEYEPMEYCLAFADKVDWVWVDCFTQSPISLTTYAQLRKYFKICAVSPELQNHPREMIQSFRKQLEATPVDAVYIDFCDDWIRET